MKYLHVNEPMGKTNLLDDEVRFIHPELTTDIYWQEGANPTFLKRIAEVALPTTTYYIEKMDGFTWEIFESTEIPNSVVKKADDLYQKFLQFVVLNMEHQITEQIVGEMVLRGDFENVVISFDESYNNSTVETILMLLSYKAQFYLTMYLERGLAILTKWPKEESDEEIDDLNISIPKKSDHEYRSFE